MTETTSQLLFPVQREANLSLPYGTLPPDSYNSRCGSQPPPDFVVSRDRDGSIASLYGDDRWDLTAYDPLGRTKTLLFDAWTMEKPNAKQLLLVGEMKWYMFIIIWLRNGRPYSIATIASFLTLLSKLAKHASSQKLRIETILSEPGRYQTFISHYGSYYAEPLAMLLKFLQELGEDKGGLKVCSRSLSKLRKLGKTYRSNNKQVPPIPSRVLSHVLGRLQCELADFETIADQYLELVSRCGSDPFYGRSRAAQRFRRRNQPDLCDESEFEYRPEFPELLDTFGLREYFANKRLLPDSRALSRGLLQLQSFAVLQIHAYSGMRRSEVEGLKYGCIGKRTIAGKKNYFISGHTTKQEGGHSKVARWVTSPEGARAVKCAERIARAIYSILGIDPDSKKSGSTNLPLFVSTKYLRPSESQSHVNPKKIALSHLASAWKMEFLSGISTTILEEDIAELEYIDPHRAWRAENNFEIGKHWRLTTHQFRRSLALYASRSGLVSLPSLRRQLQHITEAMTLYYARGSAFAKDLMSEAMHFGKEYWITQPESEALAYLKHVLMSDEKLFGGYGRRVSELAPGERLTGTYSENRDRTVTRARRGELAYKETVLGGCTEPGSCDKKAMRSIVGCLSCAQAVIKLSKLELVIDSQRSLVSSLETGTVEQRMESDDLAQMQSFREKSLLESSKDG